MWIHLVWNKVVTIVPYTRCTKTVHPNLFTQQRHQAGLPSSVFVRYIYHNTYTPMEWSCDLTCAGHSVVYTPVTHMWQTHKTPPPFLHPSLQNKLIMYKKSTELYTWLFHAGHVVWLVVINIANMSRYFSTSFLLRLAIFYTKALIFCTFYKNILRPSISNFIIYISKVRQYSWEVRRSIWM